MLAEVQMNKAMELPSLHSYDFSLNTTEKINLQLKQGDPGKKRFFKNSQPQYSPPTKY